MQKRLPARSMFFAIFVILMVSLISGALLSLAHLRQTRLDINQTQQEVIQNANSGFQLLLSQKEPIATSLNLFEEGKDSVYIKKQSWGWYDVLHSRASISTLQRAYTHSKTALMGCNIQNKQKSALYFVDNHRKLSLVGTTRIEGIVYLPQAGVVRGYINGQSYFGDKLIYGERRRSSRNLPPLNQEKLSEIQQELLKKSGVNSIADNISQSFEEHTFEIYAPTVYIKNQRLKGNIIVRSDSLIYIGRNAQLENILLFAPNIIFESGFKGSVQAFATNIIRVETGVELQYPSTITLLPSTIHQNIEQGIYINTKALVEGLVLVNLARNVRNPPILLKVESDAQITGEMYSSTKINFRGRLFGHLSTFGFIHQTPASTFDNHLMNVEINYTKRPEAYISPSYISKSLSNQVVKWID